MELQIKEYAVPQSIDFNFEELKTEVANKMDYYRNLVYTDDQISEAKKDRATLRKFVDTLDAKRKEVKAEINAPYAAFEKKLKEITSLIEGPIQLIDKQVKEYEEVQKAEKEDRIIKMWRDEMEPPKEFALKLIWNPKWLNATYAMNAIREEMTEAIEKFHNDLGVIESMSSEFSFEAKEEYYSTLDLSSAIRKINFLSEQKKRKEAVIAVDEARKVAVEPNEQDLVPEYRRPEYEQTTTVCFRATLTLTQAKALNEFCKANGIVLERI